MKFKKYLTFLRDNWPETSYLKSIDYWMVLCYISVFYYILECCVLIYIESKRTPESKGPVGPTAIYIEPKNVGFHMINILKKKSLIKYSFFRKNPLILNSRTVVPKGVYDTRDGSDPFTISVLFSSISLSAV